MEQMKQYTINLLTEVITKYIESEGIYDTQMSYINSKGNYVFLCERSDSKGLDYSIRTSALDAEYDSKHELDGGEIIFQFNEDYGFIDEEWLATYISDYEDYINNREKYIIDKVDYIISLTW